MTTSAVIPDRLRLRLEKVGHSQASLARALGISQPTIARLATGTARGSTHLHEIARALETTPAYLTGQTDDPSLGALPKPTPELIAEQLDVVQLPMLDLKFAMGGGSILAEQPDAKMISVSREWVRAFTNSNPKHLFMGTGIGDSMAPTIQDGDLFLGDRSQNEPRMGDQIWALVYHGHGMIKRLRPMENGYRILSDNPNVPPDTATDEHMSIIGRVVAVMRRI